MCGSPSSQAAMEGATSSRVARVADALRSASADEIFLALQALGLEERRKVLEAAKRLECPDFMLHPSVPDGFGYSDGDSDVVKNAGNPRQWVQWKGSSPELCSPQCSHFSPGEQLGISAHGVLEFLRIIGLLKLTEDGAYAYNDLNPLVLKVIELKRDPNDKSRAYFDVSGSMMYAAMWLRENGYGNMSMCETVKTGSHFEDIRHTVADATVIVSGDLRADPLQLLNRLRDLPPNLSRQFPPEGKRFFWHDQVSMKVGSSFDLKRFYHIHANIGRMYIDLDLPRSERIKLPAERLDGLRSFRLQCGMATAVLLGCKVVVNSKCAAADLEEAIAQGELEIALENADEGTQDSDQLQALREVVENSGLGYATLNKIFQAALIGGGIPSSIATA
eukprot:TRINITY_DN75373_c0_g1_i1.p1 TRINITY_DN75373_c0_g1~~TRINITY_DN75373_c0_g1_i1.p1  ORF type:complete len:391 (-),score=47.13 TRINITY_DN75373_c0_g1_i1:271-1443(-)